MREGDQHACWRLHGNSTLIACVVAEGDIHV